MKKKVTIANPEALTRLRAIEMLQSGNSQREVAQEFNVHQTTIGEWVRMYEEGGAEALKVPIKPRPKYLLNVDELKGLIGKVGNKEGAERRLSMLIDLAETGKLNETAAKHGITPQGLAKVRREFIEGKFPKTIIL